MVRSKSKSTATGWPGNAAARNGRRSERTTAEAIMPASRETIWSQTSAWALPARVPAPLSAMLPRVPPVASMRMVFSWCWMKAVNGSTPRELPAKSMRLAPLGHTVTCPFSRADALSR